MPLFLRLRPPQPPALRCNSLELAAPAFLIPSCSAIPQTPRSQAFSPNSQSAAHALPDRPAPGYAAAGRSLRLRLRLRACQAAYPPAGRTPAAGSLRDWQERSPHQANPPAPSIAPPQRPLAPQLRRGWVRKNAGQERGRGIVRPYHCPAAWLRVSRCQSLAKPPAALRLRLRLRSLKTTPPRSARAG